MIYNNLIGLEVTKEYIEHGFKKTELLSRHTGKSTAIALQTIAEAIRNPTKKIKIQDHLNTHRDASLLTEKIKKIIDLLHLQHLDICYLKHNLKFNLYGDTENEDR